MVRGRLATPVGVKPANENRQKRSRTYGKRGVEKKQGFLPHPAPSKPRPSTCTIYFISTDDVPDYPIKIGLTFGSLSQRLNSLQTGCPHRLRVLAAFTAPRRHEWFLHLNLRPHRMSGEWFTRSPEVLAALEEAIKNNHPARRSKGRIKL